MCFISVDSKTDTELEIVYYAKPLKVQFLNMKGW